MPSHDAGAQRDLFAEAPVLLDVRELSVDYVLAGKPPAPALRDISFHLRQGEMLGIVGESGSGKTTLMLSLMRLLPSGGRIVGGQVNFLGRDLLTLREQEMADVRWNHMAIVFQGAMNALNPVRTVGSQIAEPIARHKMTTLRSLTSSVAPSAENGTPQAIKPFNPIRTVGSQIAESIVRHEGVRHRGVLQRRVEELLELVGIGAARKDQYPHQYSGGMRQRAMIAMALACLPEVIIADEPTTALDVMVQAQILDLLAHLREQLGLAVLLVTHDLGVVAEVCDSVLVMYGGTVAEYASVDTVYNEPYHPYTQALLQAFPDMARADITLASIPGTPPRLEDLPPGCRFAPRCPEVFARCHTAMPPLYTIQHFQQARCYLADNNHRPRDNDARA